MIAYGTMRVRAVTHPRYRYIGTYRPSPGAPLRKTYFSTKAAAVAARDAWESGCRRRGETPMTHQELLHVALTASQCADEAMSLPEVLQAGMEALRAQKQSMHIDDLIRDRLHQLDRESSSQLHIDLSRGRLEKFAMAFAGRSVGSITTEEVSSFLEKVDGGAVTVLNYRGSLHALFERAVRSGQIERNPVAHAYKPRRPSASKGLLTPDQLDVLLRTLMDEAPDLVAGVSLAAFTGVRVDSELPHLRAADLVGDQLRIERSKTRAHAVPVEPNLAAWLAWAGLQQWPRTLILWPPDARERFRRVRARVISPWPRNALRHSYASYWLALHADANRLSEAMGNSPKVLKSNYQALVTPEDARAWFAIRP